MVYHPASSAPSRFSWDVQAWGDGVVLGVSSIFHACPISGVVGERLDTGLGQELPFGTCIPIPIQHPNPYPASRSVPYWRQQPQGDVNQTMAACAGQVSSEAALIVGSSAEAGGRRRRSWRQRLICLLRCPGAPHRARAPRQALRALAGSARGWRCCAHRGWLRAP